MIPIRLSALDKWGGAKLDEDGAGGVKGSKRRPQMRRRCRPALSLAKHP